MQTPVTATGEAIDGASDVSDSDPSGVVSTSPNPKILINNKVYTGHNDGDSCNTRIPRNEVNGYNGQPVTYCFNVTNPSNTWLTNVKITNQKLNYQNDSIGMLAPGQTIYVAYPHKITGDLRNVATVTGTPSSSSGEPIPHSNTVKSEDASKVKVLGINPQVEITNKVYAGHNSGESCGTSVPVKQLEGYQGDSITYCFRVYNRGNSYLNGITIENSDLAFIDHSIGLLAPGASAIVPFETKLTKTHTNKAIVRAVSLLGSHHFSSLFHFSHLV